MEDSSLPEIMEETAEEVVRCLEELRSLGHLPVGLGHRPTVLELVRHYLWRKNEGSLPLIDGLMIPVVDAYGHDPLVLLSGGSSRLMFVPRLIPGRNHNQHNGLNSVNGLWMVTEDEKEIKEGPGSPPVGNRRTLLFYRQCEHGIFRTPWVIHEYTSIPKPGPYVLCCLFECPEEVASSSTNHAGLGGEAHIVENGTPSSSNNSVAAVTNDPDGQNTISSTVEAEVSDGGYVLCRLFKHAGEALLFPTTNTPSTVPVEAETLIANGFDNEIYQWAVSMSSIFDDEDEDDYYN